MSSFYDRNELEQLGLKNVGSHVMISKKCSIYTPENIVIGDNVRIDDFCILSGTVTIGNYVHISAFSALYGKFGIEIGNYCGVSPHCLLFSASDDFSGEFMISPMVPVKLTNVQGGLIKLYNFVQIGAGSIILPNVKIGEGVAVGAMSLIKNNLDPWGIYAGVPGRRIKERKRNIIDLVATIERIKS